MASDERVCRVAGLRRLCVDPDVGCEAISSIEKRCYPELGGDGNRFGDEVLSDREVSLSFQVLGIVQQSGGKVVRRPERPEAVERGLEG